MQNLPHTCVRLILNDLSTKDTLNLAQTCRRFHETVIAETKLPLFDFSPLSAELLKIVALVSTGALEVESKQWISDALNLVELLRSRNFEGVTAEGLLNLEFGRAVVFDGIRRLNANSLYPKFARFFMNGLIKAIAPVTVASLFYNDFSDFGAGTNEDYHFQVETLLPGYREWIASNVKFTYVSSLCGVVPSKKRGEIGVYLEMMFSNKLNLSLSCMHNHDFDQYSGDRYSVSEIIFKLGNVTVFEWSKMTDATSIENSKSYRNNWQSFLAMEKTLQTMNVPVDGGWKSRTELVVRFLTRLALLNVLIEIRQYRQHEPVYVDRFENMVISKLRDIDANKA